MSPTNELEKRQCPTRTDGGDPLICHLIDPATCQRRQREHYHKCPTCAYQNGGVVPRVSVLPPRREPAPAAPAPSPVPLRVHRAG